MNEKYGRVLTTCIYDKLETGFSQIPIHNEREYQQDFKKRNKNGGYCELVGLDEYQVKPYFDIDGKGEDFDENIIDNIIEDIKSIVDTEVYKAKRPAREEKGVIKHSYRLYLKARISYYNVLNIFKNVFDKYLIIDKSVYNKNRRLFLPLSDKKMKFSVPPLNPIKGSVLDCSATYILQDYEDLDLRIVKKQSDVEKLLERFKDMIDVQYDGNLNFNEIITKFDKERASDYNTWKDIGFAYINLYHRKFITRGNLYDSFDSFSSKADNYDTDGVIKFLDTNIPRLNGKGYGIKYLLDCLKTDDFEYYKTITHKELLIESANDDIGACQIVIDNYKDILIICNGDLYVKYDHVWISNPKQVDNLLLDLIGKLDIKFLGIDGKRKYSYNKSVKHIKDCIVCIRANQSIIDNNFSNNMIKNNKYYIPFRNGIYSFKDKKLYPFNELPNVNFTYKIDRNFPKYDEQAYQKLMNKVIIPIYPNESERTYNAHIKARALAGCYEDKVWYGYSGSRNSGKGTESGLLRSGFGNFVLDFNAKCLVLNRFNNPDVAKALNWVVDKKEARIIISNEIDIDDNTILNGAFIKSLASGGDVMEGRRLYENTQSFVPQFTMFLCYNKFCKVEPRDATENLIQFEYKSKFVEEHELVEGAHFLKLKDDSIKELIKDDSIIDAYILYILNAFTNPRMELPESIKESSRYDDDDADVPIETFIVKNFVQTRSLNDKIHTANITTILNNNNYNIPIIEVGRLMKRICIGKYNKNCSIDGIRKNGYDYIKYVGVR